MSTLAQELNAQATRRAWAQACREAIARGARINFLPR